MFRFLHRKSPRQKYFEAVAEKYGSGVVPPSRVYPRFEEVARVDRSGFATLRPGRYGRRVSDDIVQLIHLMAVKGGGYVVLWGVSLGFVPHRWEKELRWHRSFKASRLDLFERPWEHFCPSDWRSELELYGESLNGEVFLRETLETMWDRVKPGLDAWFQKVATIEVLPGVAREHLEREARCMGRNPSPVWSSLGPTRRSAS